MYDLLPPLHNNVLVLQHNNFQKEYAYFVVLYMMVTNICQVIWLCGILTLGYMFINKISQWLANIFFRVLGEETMTHIFCLNNGDKNIQKRIDKEIHKSKLFIIGNVFGTFVLNLVCTLICATIVK